MTKQSQKELMTIKLNKIKLDRKYQIYRGQTETEFEENFAELHGMKIVKGNFEKDKAVDHLLSSFEQDLSDEQRAEYHALIGRSPLSYNAFFSNRTRANGLLAIFWH